MKEKIINRLDHNIKELKVQIERMEAEYKKLPYGTTAFDLTLQLERAKGELRALEETRLYIKFDV